ncbi:hypothetical protein EV194_102306 [Natronoflexus pectinivorans]|uniref:Uncharacterized protein n=1 Tax=Natronoflexus pectinivorans TaxID=682526 RepID=A0A4R2GMB4_9BACT|nr:hypothetical protein EV194_102306 [Natronoflexus pectinivorans]
MSEQAILKLQKLNKIKDFRKINIICREIDKPCFFNKVSLTIIIY